MVKNRHILGIQDTTEINYQANDGRAHGLGIVGNRKDIGFFMHPMLALDEGGVDALIDQSRRKPNIKNRVDESVELSVKGVVAQNRRIFRFAKNMA